jgi:hypothetical protein
MYKPDYRDQKEEEHVETLRLSFDKLFSLFDSKSAHKYCKELIIYWVIKGMINEVEADELSDIELWKYGQIIKEKCYKRQVSL